MKAAVLLPVMVALLFAGEWGRGLRAADVTLTEADNGQTVTVQSGQSILLNLRGNPSTGFTWIQAAIAGDSVLSTGPSGYVPDSEGGAGSAGTFTFPFQAVSPGSAVLSLDYLQPWNPDNVADSYSVTLVVQAVLQPPLIRLALEGATLTLVWSQAGSEGFLLEGSRSLSPSSWAALSVAVLPAGTNYEVRLGIDGDAHYFRLRE